MSLCCSSMYCLLSDYVQSCIIHTLVICICTIPQSGWMAWVCEQSTLIDIGKKNTWGSMYCSVRGGLLPVALLRHIQRAPRNIENAHDCVVWSPKTHLFYDEAIHHEIRSRNLETPFLSARGNIPSLIRHNRKVQTKEGNTRCAGRVPAATHGLHRAAENKSTTLPNVGVWQKQLKYVEPIYMSHPRTMRFGSGHPQSNLTRILTRIQ